MKKLLLNRPILLMLMSLFLSMGIMYWHSIGNVPYCLDSPVCRLDMEPKGTIKKIYYGYPLNYKAVSYFYPINSDANKPNYAGFAQASTELQKFTPINILINTVFWFALLKLLVDRFPAKKESIKPDELT